MGNDQSCNLHIQLLSMLNPNECTTYPLVNGRVFQIRFGNNNIGISIKYPISNSVYKTALWCFSSNKVIYNFMWMYYDKEIYRVRRLVLNIIEPNNEPISEINNIITINSKPKPFYSEYDHGIVILNKSPE